MVQQTSIKKRRRSEKRLGRTLEDALVYPELTMGNVPVPNDAIQSAVGSSKLIKSPSGEESSGLKYLD